MERYEYRAFTFAVGPVPRRTTTVYETNGSRSLLRPVRISGKAFTNYTESRFRARRLTAAVPRFH